MNLTSSIRAAGGPLVQPSSFTRLFPGNDRLRSWEPGGLDLDEKLLAIEGLASGVFERAESEDPPNDESLPAAYTFFGQFVTHDLSFRTGGGMPLLESPERLPNLRNPAFELDSVYGAGPVQAPYFFDPDDPQRFLIGRNTSGEPDLPRVQDRFGRFPRQGRALIGDPRNDENIVVSQLHLAFLRFHNSWIDRGATAEEARRATVYHYQRLVIEDFLKRFCRPNLVDALLDGHEPFVLFQPARRGAPDLPVEFTFGAFRALHAMIGPEYELSDPLHAELGRRLAFMGENDGASDLRGLRALPERWSIQWDRFLHPGPGTTQPARRLGLHMARPLRKIQLPGAAKRDRNLLYRDLVRGWRARIPSGQSLAAELRRRLPSEESYELRTGSDDPLLLYVLAEADAERTDNPESQRRFGPLGERIVAETMVGLMQHSATSYLHAARGTAPTAPSGEGFELWDLMQQADMPLTEADLRARVSFPGPTPRPTRDPRPVAAQAASYAGSARVNGSADGDDARV